MPPLDTHVGCQHPHRRSSAPSTDFVNRYVRRAVEPQPRWLQLRRVRPRRPRSKLLLDDGRHHHQEEGAVRSVHVSLPDDDLLPFTNVDIRVEAPFHPAEIAALFFVSPADRDIQRKSESPSSRIRRGASPGETVTVLYPNS